MYHLQPEDVGFCTPWQRFKSPDTLSDDDQKGGQADDGSKPWKKKETPWDSEASSQAHLSPLDPMNLRL